MNTGIECRHEKFPGYSLDLNQRGQFSILQEESLKQSESQPYKKIISGLKNENYSIYTGVDHNNNAAQSCSLRSPASAGVRTVRYEN